MRLTAVFFVGPLMRALTSFTRLCLAAGLLLAGVFVFQVSAEQNGYLYKKAVHAADEGRIDTAYMYYNSILRSGSEKYKRQALFAKAEYYMLSVESREAKKYFREFAEVYPDAKEVLFAYIQLYHFAKTENDTAALAEWQRKILSMQQVSLIFRDVKEFPFQSPLRQSYLAVYTIDHIDFFLNGSLFEEIKY